MIGFEPDAEECRRLNEEAGPHERHLPFALGAADSTVPFHITAWPVASSIYPTDGEFLSRFADGGLLRTVEVGEIETRTLDGVCEEQGAWPDVLKLDVEGAELDALRGGERAAWGSLAIDLEVAFAPFRVGAPLFAEVDSHLGAMGFALAGLSRVFWRQRVGDLELPRLVQGDALYLNEDALASRDDEATRARIALILAAYAPDLSARRTGWQDASLL